MNPRIHPARRAARLLLPLALAGCAGMGSMGDVLGGIAGGDVSGEIRRVDERRQEIQIRTSHGGTETLDYDRDTRVEYRQERYPVRALEPGDEVSVQVRAGRGGDRYAGYIRVHRSVQERRGDRYPSSDRDQDRDWEWDRDRDEDRGYAREQTFGGRVERIDRRAGWFVLREDRGTRRVVLPRGAPSSVVSRFRGLRSGDRVRIDGRLLRNDRVELRRFR